MIPKDWNPINPPTPDVSPRDVVVQKHALAEAMLSRLLLQERRLQQQIAALERDITGLANAASLFPAPQQHGE